MRSRVGGTPIPPATDGRRNGHGRGWHRESDRTTATDAGNQTNSKAVWTGPSGPMDAAAGGPKSLAPTSQICYALTQIFRNVNV